MSSSIEYVAFIMEQLNDLEDVRCRPMMGEYLIYYRDKVIGGIYNDRFLVKPVEAAVQHMQEPVYELPYEGGKPMLLVQDVDQRAFLCELLIAMYEELPFPKPRKPKKL